MRLIAVGIKNFRSIGASPVFVRLDKPVQVLIGPNNSGKSNVIRALQWLEGANQAPPRLNMDELDCHNQDKRNALGVVVRVQLEEQDHFGMTDGPPVEFAIQLRDGEFACVGHPFAELDCRQFEKGMEHWLHITFRGTPSAEFLMNKQLQVGKVMALGALRRDLPPVRLVPQFRQMRDGEEALDGTGAVRLLSSWKRPGPGEHNKMANFVKVQDLVRRLLRLPGVELDVDHTNAILMVTHIGLRLPLSSYGTGVHELIILAIAVCREEDALYCIEEPEIHLHPRLQREFLRFLIEESDKRYVLTTHSPALLAMSERVHVTRLWVEDGATVGQLVDAPEYALQALDDLGFRASDILQANSVIWVEGPSDRVYIKRWLTLLEPTLREGIDYSIMFYGGRLLSHVSLRRLNSADSAFPDPQDLIPLLRLNQHSIMVMDSDRPKSGARLGKSKLRVKKECQENGIVCWVTDGREIENYLPGECIKEAYAETPQGKPVRLAFEKYDRLEDQLKKAYRSPSRTKLFYNSAKPVMARRIVLHVREEHIGKELRKHLSEVIDAIKAANA